MIGAPVAVPLTVYVYGFVALSLAIEIVKLQAPETVGVIEVSNVVLPVRVPTGEVGCVVTLAEQFVAPLMATFGVPDSVNTAVPVLLIV